jgi:hypothetical protein
MKKFAVMLLSVLLVFAGIEIERWTYPPPAKAASSFAVISCDQSTAVSSAASVQIITAGNANMFIYVCGYSFGSIGGSTFSVVEGTGTTCATNIKAVAGGTTAAAGYGLTANGLINEGSGVGEVMKTAVAGDNLCLITAGTGPLAGVVSWTSAPY